MKRAAGNSKKDASLNLIIRIVCDSNAIHGDSSKCDIVSELDFLPVKGKSVSDVAIGNSRILEIRRFIRKSSTEESGGFVTGPGICEYFERR